MVLCNRFIASLVALALHFFTYCTARSSSSSNRMLSSQITSRESHHLQLIRASEITPSPCSCMAAGKAYGTELYWLAWPLGNAGSGVRSQCTAEIWDQVPASITFIVSWSSWIAMYQGSMVCLVDFTSPWAPWGSNGDVIHTSNASHTTSVQVMLKCLSSSFMNIKSLIWWMNPFVARPLFLMQSQHSAVCFCIPGRICIQSPGHSFVNVSDSWIIFVPHPLSIASRTFMSICRKNVLSLGCVYLM